MSLISITELSSAFPSWLTGAFDFFYKNIVFPAQAEVLIFLPMLGQKLFL